MTTEAELVEWVRAALGAVETESVRMFGGTGFMLAGNLLAAASKRGLLLRVGEAQREQVLARQGARPMVMHGRVMRDYVYLDSSGLDRKVTGECLRLALKFVGTLPPNAARQKRKSRGKPAAS